MIFENDILEKFCTPPVMDITHFDLKAVDSSEKECICFEGINLPVYSWGSGRKILLVHGWGSRASHLSLIAKMLSGAGFKVYSFDAPAHSSTGQPQKIHSSMFEFGKAVSAVANNIGPVYAVVAHSLGSIASLFASCGYKKFEKYFFDAEKFVSVCSPFTLKTLIDSYCRINNLTAGEKNLLESGLEKHFDFSIPDYSLDCALQNFSHDMLIIHDEDDENIPLGDAYNFYAAVNGSKLKVSKGLGHKKILLHRDTIKSIVEFLV